jgi:COP9 signalosome complex subunit 3
MDGLSYHYLGGVLFAMLKRWPEAIDYFDIACSFPTQSPNSASALQLEALKKLLLIQLIAYGKSPGIPKYAPPALSRALKSSPYTVLLKHYPGTAKDTYSPSEKDVKIFSGDGNMGLVSQVMEKAVGWRVKEITGTYVALGLGEICDIVGVSRDEVRCVLLAMVRIS